MGTFVTDVTMAYSKVGDVNFFSIFLLIGSILKKYLPAHHIFVK